jgi:CheY-like chemotaxis protein
MPGMDGIEFVKRVRGSDNPQIQGTPIVLVSGVRTDELPARGIEAGASAFLRKPVDSVELVEVVERLLSLKTP